MSMFDSQHIRKRLNIAWGEDYVLGLIDRTAPTTSTRILDLIKKQGAITQPTGQKYMKSLLTRRLISRKPDPDDKRMATYNPTEKGKNIMKELRDAVK